MVINFLPSDWHSGSWKNNFLTVVKEIYAEAPYYGLPYIPVPKFLQFKRNSVKKDIFTTKELNVLFDENLWIELSRQMYEKQAQYDEGHEAIFLMFLCSAKCRLRIGEAIGLHVNQFLFEHTAIEMTDYYTRRDIKRYSYDWAGLWLIWIPWLFPLHLDSSIQGASEKAEREFKKQYSAVYNYLLGYKKELSERNKAETGIRYEWNALQRWGANYSDKFSVENIRRLEILYQFFYRFYHFIIT